MPPVGRWLHFPSVLPEAVVRGPARDRAVTVTVTGGLWQPWPLPGGGSGLAAAAAATAAWELELKHLDSCIL